MLTIIKLTWFQSPLRGPRHPNPPPQAEEQRVPRGAPGRRQDGHRRGFFYKNILTDDLSLYEMDIYLRQDGHRRGVAMGQAMR